MSTESLLQANLGGDPRIAEARQLMQQVLRERRSKIWQVVPSDPARETAYENALKQFGEIRAGALYYPYLSSGIGNGPFVELADGSVKFDMISGIGVHAFGHSDEGLIKAAFEAALQDTVMQGNLQQNVESFELSKRLLEFANFFPSPLKHVFLTTSGATANENALKLLFQAKSPASRILAFENCFAGRTLATSQITDRPKNRTGLPTVLPVDYIPFAPVIESDVELQGDALYDAIQVSVNRLVEHLDRYPGQHAGMIMELVQGEGGYYTAPRRFFEAICLTLRKYNVPIWFDEIQTFGRLEQPFAFQAMNLSEYADVVSVGKITQVCATLFREELKPGPGLISQTFTGATSSIFASLHILDRLEFGKFYGKTGRIAQVRERFRRRFEQLSIEHPEHFNGPWGVGGMIAFTAFGGAEGPNKAFLQRLYQNGVIAFGAGQSPVRVRLLPPFGVITDPQIDDVCEIIRVTLINVRESINEPAR